MTRSPVHDRHVSLGAKFAEFGGWEMPLEYAGRGVLAEQAAVRGGVGVFDVSHLGKARVLGAGAAAYVDASLTNSLAKIEPGKAQYTLCCDADTGGIVDDLIVYLRGDDEVFLVPNAANTQGVVRRLAASAPAGVTVDDLHHDLVIFAVQGPKSPAVLSALGLPADHAYMSFVDADWNGVDVTVCRSGYTGERGYELIAPVAAGERLWAAVLDAGADHDIAPCGLGARDTLRQEMGYPLHGQDISLDVTPVQARLTWAVGWKKPEFWGRDALLAERSAGAARVLRGLEATGRGIPRPHMTASVDDRPVGELTSGTFSPTLRKGIGMALLDASVEENSEVSVDIRGRRETFVVRRPPFVESHVTD